MTFVERTCTVLEGGDAQAPAYQALDPLELALQIENGTLDWEDWAQSAMSGRQTTGKPLSCYAERPAWVLLAPAGAGKTVAFKREAERPGAYYTTARDFVVLNRPEWRSGTVFIDALDEMRAGATDGRTPLDEIRKKLDEMHNPPFRLSCREADWFGVNDRSDLEKVAQDGNVLVLRLDPVTDGQVWQLLAERPDVVSAEAFVERAKNNGLGSLLNNPQTLDLLVRAEAEGTPRSRSDTFELACKQLVRECNDEHVIGRATPANVDELLDAAGKLCAVCLLSGHKGYAVRTAQNSQEFIPLPDIQRPTQKRLEAALHTGLFADSDGIQCPEPVHRQIAEFLAARYLAQRVKKGLPRKRITALAQGLDGGVVTDLRGLVAWLAALDGEFRADCIERDPLDTMLYGDVRGFTLDDKRRLLQRIKERATGDPWLLRNRFDLNARWGGLATKDAEPIFREELTNIAPGDAGQLLAENLLQALIYGDEALPLDDLLLDIVRNRNDKRWPRLQSHALHVFVKWHSEGSGTDRIRDLLHEVESGIVKDPLDDLRGILLKHLYPNPLGPAEVIQYLHEPKQFLWIGTYLTFCNSGIIDSSTPCQLEQLLDGLCDQEDGDVLRTLCNKILRHLLKQALDGARGTHTKKPLDDVPVKRLFNWLSMERDWETDDALAYWLTMQPGKYKELVVEAAAHRERSILGTMSWLQDCEPPDFGRWCLDQAIGAEDDALTEFYIEGVFFCLSLGRGCEGLSTDVVTRRMQKHPHIEKHCLDAKRRYERHDVEAASTQKDLTADWRKSWQDWLRAHTKEVRTNCPRAVLYELGRMCLGGFNLAGDTPEKRLHGVLQDDDLVKLALRAIRDTPKRDDLPSVAEVAKSKETYLLATPFAAALKLARHPQLDMAGETLALAFRFHSDGLGDWYETVLEKQPDLVADTLLTYCRTAFKHGNYPSFRFLAEPKHAAVAQSVALKLLKAFPPRCRAEHLAELRRLLVAALKHAREGLPELVRHKAALSSMTAMQRVHWLCCGLGLEPANHREGLIKALTGRREYERILYAIGLMARPRRNGAGARHDQDEGVLPVDDLDVESAEALVEHLGTRWPPSSLTAGRSAANSRSAIVGSVADAADVSTAVERLINHLASRSESAATDALERLAENALLERWQDRLRHAVGRQLETRREAEFQYATVEQVQKTLDGGNPTNSADLAALTTDHLRQLAESIARGNTSDWRQYWDSPQGAPQPRHEDLCRDALLSDLRRLLPEGIDAQPEGRYAADRRADIRVSCKGFNVPVEIKKSTHRTLWSAIGTQLTEYAKDPRADGHGIYLVFWFGPEDCPRPPDGEKPQTPQQLEAQLQRTLAPEKARKIDVVVIDVSDQKRAVPAGV